MDLPYEILKPVFQTLSFVLENTNYLVNFQIKSNQKVYGNAINDNLLMLEEMFKHYLFEKT